MRRGLLLPLVLAAACASTPPAPDEPAKVPREEPVSIEILGNETVSGTALRAAATRELKDLAESGAHPADAADAAWAMEGVLRERGFAHGRVEFEIEGRTTRFLVEEGPRAYLGAVRFIGARRIGEAELRPFFGYPGTGLLGGEPPLFVLDRIEASTTEVRRHYALSGFRDARIADAEIVWNEDKTRADVTVRIREGRRYIVLAVEFVGVAPRELGFVGRPYHARVPLEASARLRRQLYDEGRQFARVKASVEVDAEEAIATIRLEAEPGPVVRLRKLEIEGTDRTRDSFARSLVPIEEGGPLLQTRIDRARQNLFASGLFRHVEVHTSEVDEDELDVRITVEEAKTRNLDFEVGWGSYEKIRGAVRYGNDNLFGFGRRFRVTLDGSTKHLGLDGAIVDPWLLGDRNRLELTGGLLYREEPSFDRVSYNFALTFVRRTRGGFTLRAGYHWKSEEARNVQVPDLTSDEFINTAGVFATFRMDLTDDVLQPTRGWLIDFGLGWNTPYLGSELDFLDFFFSVARYIQVAERTVVAVGVRLRSRPILDDAATLPIQERLFNGGDTTVRSFGRDELGPTFNGSPVGGLTMAVFNLELRTRVRGDLYGAVFFDVGYVSLQSFTYTEPPGYGVGVGLRYMLPIGPVRLDVGYNPAELFAATSRWQVHLSVGFSF